MCRLGALALRCLAKSSRHDLARVAGWIQPTIARHQTRAELSQNHAAAAATADLGASHPMIKTRVQVLEQQPRATVAHMHFARGLRQRPGALDPFQKLDLADPDGAAVAEVDAKSHGEGVDLGFRPRQSFRAGAAVTVSRTSSWNALLNCRMTGCEPRSNTTILCGALQACCP